MEPKGRSLENSIFDVIHINLTSNIFQDRERKETVGDWLISVTLLTSTIEELTDKQIISDLLKSSNYFK